jgi:hypothetical protein
LPSKPSEEQRSPPPERPPQGHPVAAEPKPSEPGPSTPRATAPEPSRPEPGATEPSSAGDVSSGLAAQPPSEPAANAAAAKQPQGPTKSENPFPEDDLPPDFWDDRVAFDDLVPADGAPPRRDRAAPEGESRPANADSGRESLQPPRATGDGAGGAAVERTQQHAAPDVDVPDADDAGAESSATAGEDAFAALRQLFPGRILSVEPFESADDRPTDEDVGSGGDEGPLFDGPDDADGAGVGVD